MIQELCVALLKKCVMEKKLDVRNELRGGMKRLKVQFVGQRKLSWGMLQDEYRCKKRDALKVVYDDKFAMSEKDKSG